VRVRVRVSVSVSVRVRVRVSVRVGDGDEHVAHIPRVILWGLFIMRGASAAG
jgi:hypothetical protein